MSLATLIKRLQDIMRNDTGVDGDAQRLSQIVWLLFLKIFDFKEEEAELDDDYEPVIPVGYRWRDWATCIDNNGNVDVKNQLTGSALIDFVNNELLPVLRGNAVKDKEGNDVIPFDKTDDRSLLVKEFMNRSINYMNNGIQLRLVVNLFDEVDFSDSNETHHFNDIYETLLKSLQSAGRAGEFYSSRALTRFANQHVDPKLGETVADFSAGTGGFLVDALLHLEDQITPGDVESAKLLQTAVQGIEWKPLPYMLCVTNLLLHGVSLPNITYGDSLSKRLSDYTDKDKVDCILMNPPYGGVALQEDIINFPADLRSSETADLFVALIITRLKNNGRAAVILPDGFLFGTDNAAKVNIKKKLLNECNLHTVIRLPKSCFAPYTSIATNMLFFNKTSKTQETWFYRMDMPEGYKAFSKTKPLLYEHMAPVSEWWDHRIEIKDADTNTYKAKKYTFDEIEANGYNLDLCGYPTQEKIILSPEETMNNFIVRREELDKIMNEKLAAIKVLLEA